MRFFQKSNRYYLSLAIQLTAFFLIFIKLTPLQDIALSADALQVFYKAYFSYYNTLDAVYQRIFIERCQVFISKKHIAGAEGFAIDNRVKAIVAASAVQLTLGLETWDLDYFKTIVIYPSDFDDSSRRLKFRGETNLAGFMRLSWKGIIKGYEITNDNINLGLHEFSHALRFNGIKGNDQDYFVEHYFYNWMASAYEAFYDIKHNRNDVFRKYGGTNINEFVSVCIEHYFESPADIKEEYPLLYFSTAALLNQCTENGRTRIGVRQSMLDEKTKLLPGFSGYHFAGSLNKGSFFTCVIFLILFIFSASNIGIDNALSIFLLSISFLAYARLDLHFVRVQLDKKELILKKGLLLFAWRKPVIVPASQLLSARDNSDAYDRNAWELIIYNSHNGYFYQENLVLGAGNARRFVEELALNKAMYFK